MKIAQDERYRSGQRSRVVPPLMLGSSSAEACRPNRARTSRDPRGDGRNRAPPRGEHGISCNTIACGIAGFSGASAVKTCARTCYLFCAQGCGCIRHPASRTPSPGPHQAQGRKYFQRLGRIAPRGANRRILRCAKRLFLFEYFDCSKIGCLKSVSVIHAQ